jgi:hypothetical protein
MSTLTLVASKLSTLINVNDLKSRITRINITGNINGTRSITQNNDQKPNGIWTWTMGLMRATIQWAGWAVDKVLGGISWTATAAWGWISTKLLQLYNFNWNIKDEEIDKLIASSNAVVGGLLGSAAGQAAGWLVCGAIPAAGIAVFNQQLGMYLKILEDGLKIFLLILTQVKANLSKK